MSETLSWNYLYFTNPQDGKTYYYFINAINYINDGTVELVLEMDVIQTFMFEFTPQISFVERMHTSSDAIGEHTIEEGLEFGDPESYYSWEPLPTELCVLVLATINPDVCTATYRADAWGNVYNGVLSGLKFFAVEMSCWQSWLGLIEDLDEWGYSDGIINMWMYPKAFITLAGECKWGEDTDVCKEVAGVTPVITNCPKGPYTDVYGDSYGYTPKNNKLYSYPYTYMYFTNYSGDGAVYQFERFLDPTNIEFAFYGALDPGGAVKGIPRFYDGSHGDGYERGLTCSAFPTCAWDSDIYKLWLAQNQNTLQHQNLTSGITMTAGAVASIGSLVMGNPMGAVGGAGGFISGAMQVGNQLAMKRDKAIQPPEAKGSYSTNINMASGKIFTVMFKRIRWEYAKMLDGYFTKYGYKLNQMIIPRWDRRKSHTYVKTIGFNARGALKNEIMLKIASIFDNGITFWMNGDRIGMYEDDNDPIS